MNENLTYHRTGDFLLPDLVPPEAPNIGVWGLRRKNYLLKSKDGIYTGLLLSGELNTHLEETDRAANEMLSRIIEGMARRKGVTEALKAEDQMEWVRRMNAIRSAAEEVVLHDLIYA
ncbi:MAG: TnpV protein [Ruminococcaceae bacterium]|nr:TnpV protein [Oscillospiraceae bacterium]